LGAVLTLYGAVSIALAFRFAWQVLWQRFALFAAILSTFMLPGLCWKSW
jgi:hypothetical protein